jgi:hypothetical protein
MTFRNRFRDRNTLMSIGMLCLLFGNLAHWFLHPAAHFGQSLVDGMFGALIGISIACNLLSLRRTDRQCRRAEA